MLRTKQHMINRIKGVMGRFNVRNFDYSVYAPGDGARRWQMSTPKRSLPTYHATTTDFDNIITGMHLAADVIQDKLDTEVVCRWYYEGKLQATRIIPVQELLDIDKGCDCSSEYKAYSLLVKNCIRYKGKSSETVQIKNRYMVMMP